MTADAKSDAKGDTKGDTMTKSDQPMTCEEFQGSIA